jgi:hypothetical protein
MVEVLKPEYLIWGDVNDNYSVNPHHKGNVFNSIAKIASGHGNARAEAERACHFVKDHTPKGTVSVVIPDNHGDFLRRWIVNSDWRTEPGNAEFYLETALEMVRKTKFVKGFGTWYPSPFPMIFPKIVDCSNIKILREEIKLTSDGPKVSNESFALLGVELSMHGDQGPSGTRGSINNHKRLGLKSIIGHSHSPGIMEGCYQVGTSTELRLEYNSGPGAWLNSHCILHADGKRQLIIVIDGQWRK